MIQPIEIEKSNPNKSSEQLRAINAKLKDMNEKSSIAKLRALEQKLAIAKRAEDKVAMIMKRLAYRHRIAEKMRAMFGDDTANAFLSGEF